MSSHISVCERESRWLTDVIKELVACESPSGDRDALERCALLLAHHCTAAGAAVTRVTAGTTADHLLAEWGGDGPSVLVLGHFDTVWPVGQIERMPLREEDGRMYGPGIFDMKAGLGIGLVGIWAMREMRSGARRPRVRFLVTSDEEVGSATSRAAIEQFARESAAVLVLEPSLPGGALKTARKGVGEFEVIAHGVAAHAGVDPDAGASAIHELAHQIGRITALADRARGLTVNVGVVSGGTRANVIAEEARATVDVRLTRLVDAETITSALRALSPVNPRVRLEIHGGVNRPPMERTAGVARLYEFAQQVGREMGFELGEGSTGGGSDGNFTAALGVPTLDGLGAVGDGPHALHEHIIVHELPKRAALVAGILARLGAMG